MPHHLCKWRRRVGRGETHLRWLFIATRLLSQHCLALYNHSFHQTAKFPQELLVPNLETTALGLARFLVGLRTGGYIISRVVGEILMRHQNVIGLENWWQRI